jgi:ElaB/YqjD/DUF883 family membrane-anchored ribosome-binding protein
LAVLASFADIASRRRRHRCFEIGKFNKGAKIMSEGFRGEALSPIGSVEQPVGDSRGRVDFPAADETRQSEGRAKRTVGKLRDKAADVGHQVSAAAATATDRAMDAYAGAADRFDRVARRVDPFVREKPYAALGLAVVAGLLAGLVLAGRGPKVMYLKPPHE